MRGIDDISSSLVEELLADVAVCDSDDTGNDADTNADSAESNSDDGIENADKGESKTDTAFLKSLEDLSPSVAIALVDAYNTIPIEVIQSLDALQNALENLKGSKSISVVKSALKQVGKTCKCDTKYQKIVDNAVKAAGAVIAKKMQSGELSLVD